MGTVTRAQIPTEYKNAIFDLKEGQISEIEPAANGWHIFKVTKKEALPLNRARGILVSERLANIVEPFRSSIKAELNQEYFQKNDSH